MKTKHFFVTLILICLMGISAPSYAAEKDLKGEMVCKIKDQIIKKVKEGKVETFSAFTDGYEIGDNFNFRYELIYENGNQHLQFAEVKSITEKPFFRKYNLTDQKNVVNASTNGVFLRIITDPTEYSSQFVELRKNTMQFNYVADFGGYILRRYYKSDWMGMRTTVSAIVGEPLTLHHYAFDCKHLTEDLWEEIFAEVKKSLN